MMQEAWWTAHVAIMNKYFPQFAAFKTKNGRVGFCGRVRGRRTGREYTIIVKVPAQRYPEMEPAVYIRPRIAIGYWQIDGVNHDPNGRLSFSKAMGAGKKQPSPTARSSQFNFWRNSINEEEDPGFAGRHLCRDRAPCRRVQGAGICHNPLRLHPGRAL